MASKTMGFRPADHHRDFLTKLPDRSVFIRQAIDFYLAQNDKKDVQVRMIAIENQTENLEKKNDLILNVLSKSPCGQ